MQINYTPNEFQKEFRKTNNLNENTEVSLHKTGKKLQSNPYLNILKKIGFN
jgi:hypothetical protein